MYFYISRDPPPIKTFILYFVAWAAWVYTDILVKKQNVNFALKLDDILYNDSIRDIDIIQVSDYTLM